MIPSVYQKEIYKALQETNKHLAIEATAGSGKTTTILECLKLIPKNKKSIFVSFSNTIVNELKQRVPQGIEVSTLHSLGYKLLLSNRKRLQVNENRVFNTVLDKFYDGVKYKKREEAKLIYQNCYRLQNIINFNRTTLTPLNKEEIIKMCDYYSLDYDFDLIEKSIDFLKKDSSKRKSIDFVDMIYLPVSKKLIEVKYDYVFLDEAQDLNNCQKEFVEKLLGKTGRLISVGDSEQSIYSFSGSSIDSFEKLKNKPNTLSLPLSVSYRCSKNIVLEAKKVSNKIEFFENNDNGIVRKGVYKEIQDGDMVISRITRPLMVLFFKLIKDGKKCKIVGKDIEDGLLEIINRCSTHNTEQFELNLLSELDRMEENLKNIGISKPYEHIKYINLQEKIQTILLIHSKFNCNPSSLKEKIQSLFHKEKEGITLMTIHKSKGLENDRVFIITHFDGERLLPSKYAKQDWEKQQERNIEFVSLTRAKKELVFIDINDDEE